MSRNIGEHEDINLHISKSAFGIIIYLLVSFGSWGFLIYKFSQYNIIDVSSVAAVFAIQFWMIILSPFLISR